MVFRKKIKIKKLKQIRHNPVVETLQAEEGPQHVLLGPIFVAFLCNLFPGITLYTEGIFLF